MPEPKAAKQMRGYVCTHGSLHVELIDEHGEVFATGTLDTESGLQFVEMIVEDFAEGGQKRCGGLH